MLTVQGGSRTIQHTRSKGVWGIMTTTAATDRETRFHQALRELSRVLGEGKEEEAKAIRRAVWSYERDKGLIVEAWQFSDEEATVKAASEALEEVRDRAIGLAREEAQRTLDEAKQRFVEQTRDGESGTP